MKGRNFKEKKSSKLQTDKSIDIQNFKKKLQSVDLTVLFV